MLNSWIDFDMCIDISIFFSVTKGINYDKMSEEKSYSPMEAYSQSKLANVLFSKELSKKLQGTWNLIQDSCSYKWEGLLADQGIMISSFVSGTCYW